MLQSILIFISFFAVPLSLLNILMRLTAVRSGDYYLFEDVFEKVDLDMIDSKPDAAVHDKLLKRRMSTHRNLKQVISKESHTITIYIITI